MTGGPPGSQLLMALLGFMVRSKRAERSSFTISQSLIKLMSIELVMSSNHLIPCGSREGRDLGVAFQAPPGSQASSRGEAKDSALLSSRDACYPDKKVQVEA